MAHDHLRGFAESSFVGGEDPDVEISEPSGRGKVGRRK